MDVTDAAPVSMQQSVVVLFALLAVLSPLVGFAAPVAAQSAGMATVPSDQITETGIPDTQNDLVGVTGPELLDRARGNVGASEHAGTLDAEFAVLNTETGNLVNDNAVNSVLRNSAGDNHPLTVVVRLTDDSAHEGRTVSVPAALLTEMYGFQPKTAYGVHEDGSTWEDPITYEDGMATWRVPKFSTNTVSFTGTFSIAASPASDGTQYEYSIRDLDAAGNFSIEATGVENTETDTVTGSGVSNGGTVDLEVAGTDPATGASVTFTGDGFGARWDNHSTSGLSDGGSMSIDVDGNFDPNGPSVNGEPTLEVTGKRNVYGDIQPDLSSAGGGGATDVGIAFSTSRTVESVTLYNSAPSYNDYTSIEIIDTSDGSTVTTKSVSTGQSAYTIDHSSFSSGTTYAAIVSGDSIDWRENNAPYTDGDLTIEGNYNFDSVGGGDFAGFDGVRIQERPGDASLSTPEGTSWNAGGFSHGETKTTEFDIGTSASQVDVSSTGGVYDLTLRYEEREGVSDPAVDVDGDGTDEASYTGTLLGGESSTSYSLPDLSLGASADVSASAGAVNPEFAYTEHTVTVDPTVEVNGNTTSNTGTLSAGSTTSLSTDTAWLQEGTNTVNVSVGDGTLSSDAPTPQMGLSYEHDHTDDQTVTYDSQRWSSAYNMSKTYGSEASQSDLRVPFENTVYSIRSIEYRVNESGGWSSVGPSEYQLEGNDLTVDLDAAYGSAIPADTTMEVRANASKVDSSDLSLTVTEATDLGSKLDSELRIDSVGEDPSIEVGGTDNGTFVHYLYDETWQAGESAVFNAKGSQQIELPNAQAGETARVTHLPTEVVPASGDVEVTVNSAGSEPGIAIEPGPSGENTDVEFIHHATTSGEEYLLYSATNGIVRDSGTASSPVHLWDDDSDETLEITKDDGGDSTSSDTDGGSVPVVGQFTQEDGGGLNWPLIIAALAGGVGILAVVQVRTGRNPITGAAGGLRDAGSMLAARPRALAVLLLIGAAASVYFGVIAVPESVLVILVVAAVAVLSFVGLKRTGNFSMTAFGLILAGTTVAALVATGQLSDIVDALGTSGSAILVMGLIALAWRFLQNRGQPDTVNKLTFRGDSGGD